MASENLQEHLQTEDRRHGGETFFTTRDRRNTNGGGSQLFVAAVNKLYFPRSLAEFVWSRPHVIFSVLLVWKILL